MRGNGFTGLHLGCCEELTADECLVLPYWAKAYDLVAGAVCSRATAAIHPLTGETFGVNEVVKRSVRVGNLGTVQQCAVFDGYTRITHDDVSNAAWSKFSVTAPDQNTIMETSATATHVCRYVATVQNSAQHTLSVFAKPNGRTRFWLGTDNINYTVLFDMTGDGSIVTQGAALIKASIKKVGDWYLCTVGFTSYGTSLNIEFRLNDGVVSGIGDTYTGDPTKGITVYRYQLTKTANRRPYVPEAGAGVTKAVDDVTVTRDFGDGETIISTLTLYDHALQNTETSYPRPWYSGTYLNCVPNPSAPGWMPNLGGVQPYTGVITHAANTRKAIGCTWDYAGATESKVYYDEVLKDTETPTSAPSYASMHLGDTDGTGGRALNGCLIALHWTDDVLPLPVIAAFMRLLQAGITGLEEVPVA